MDKDCGMTKDDKIKLADEILREETDVAVGCWSEEDNEWHVLTYGTATLKAIIAEWKEQNVFKAEGGYRDDKFWDKFWDKMTHTEVRINEVPVDPDNYEIEGVDFTFKPCNLCGNPIVRHAVEVGKPLICPTA